MYNNGYANSWSASSNNVESFKYQTGHVRGSNDKIVTVMQ